MFEPLAKLWISTQPGKPYVSPHSSQHTQRFFCQATENISSMWFHHLQQEKPSKLPMFSKRICQEPVPGKMDPMNAAKKNNRHPLCCLSPVVRYPVVSCRPLHGAGFFGWTRMNSDGLGWIDDWCTWSTWNTWNTWSTKALLLSAIGLAAYPISWSAAIWLWQLGQGSSFATMGSSSGSMASAPMRADTRTLHFDDANQKKAAQLCQDYAKLCQSQRFHKISSCILSVGIGISHFQEK